MNHHDQHNPRYRLLRYTKQVRLVFLSFTARYLSAMSMSLSQIELSRAHFAYIANSDLLLHGESGWMEAYSNLTQGIGVNGWA